MIYDLFFAVDYLHYSLSYCLQCSFINGIHIIFHGVPMLKEISFRIVRDDIDCRDFRILVDERMVIGNETAFFSVQNNARSLKRWLFSRLSH